MKIVIVSQHYWPENFRITDIAEALVLRGNSVTVLCGLPNYPKGYIFDDYKRKKNRTQVHNGVNIVRAKEIGRRNNIIFRLLNYWSFQHYAKKIINNLDDDFDVVLINELSPIMSAIPGLKYAKKHKKRIIMYEMDLWPESLLAGGIKKGSIIYKHYKKVSSKIYSQCDKILVSTKEHINYIKTLYKCESLDIECLPQYAESLFENNNFESKDNNVIDLVFAGNVGKAQSVETIIKAAALLNNDSRYKFHIIGDGSELNNVKHLAKELNTQNVVFYGQKPLNEMLDFYRIADAMLVTLENKPYANMTIPGKVQSYMAAGKAIVGAISGACANYILDNQIGLVCQSENDIELYNAIKKLDGLDLKKMGQNAKRIYSSTSSRQIFLDKLVLYLSKLSCDESMTKDI